MTLLAVPAVHDTPVAAGQSPLRKTLWTGLLEVADTTTTRTVIGITVTNEGYGCDNDQSGKECTDTAQMVAMTSDEIDVGGNTYAVKSLNRVVEDDGSYLVFEAKHTGATTSLAFDPSLRSLALKVQTDAGSHEFPFHQDHRDGNNNSRFKWAWPNSIPTNQWRDDGGPTGNGSLVTVKLTQRDWIEGNAITAKKALVTAGAANGETLNIYTELLELGGQASYCTKVRDVITADDLKAIAGKLESTTLLDQIKAVDANAYRHVNQAAAKAREAAALRADPDSECFVRTPNGSTRYPLEEAAGHYVAALGALQRGDTDYTRTYFSAPVTVQYKHANDGSGYGPLMVYEGESADYRMVVRGHPKAKVFITPHVKVSYVYDSDTGCGTEPVSRSSRRRCR